ncbi:hypothetical protein GOBAR_AA31588 [Gossypium barbadense]|uniref:FAE domain-containing protein n=1 Tax=Gossypium barbadense TaxID=3634 RepID=A0A2P5WDB2_GOSBA|nr:hypothetical protein GOBAR_AA31588 [Gossypium barbadense]
MEDPKLLHRSLRVLQGTRRHETRHRNVWEPGFEEQKSGCRRVQVSATSNGECGHWGRNLRSKKHHRGQRRIPNLSDALSEINDIVFSTLDKLFAKTGVFPSEIDVLVVTISIISSVPSIPARVINRYKKMEDVKVFNLSGMGCSASVIAVDLVNHLFQTYKNQFAIVVSSESLSPNWYIGKERSMMLPNILFCIGGCSLLLKNKRGLKHRAILKLNHLVRAHVGSIDEAYGSCTRIEDDQGNCGFFLTKNLPKAAAKAVSMNLRVLVPKMLPLRELIRYSMVTYVNIMINGRQF